MKNIIIFSAFLVFYCGFSQEINQNLLIYYPMNGGADDFSGNDNDGIPYGVTYTADRVGNPEGACHFNGIDNYINFPNIETLKANLPVSFTFWIKYDDMSYQSQAVLNTSFEDNTCSGVWFNSRSSDNHFAVNYGDGSPYYAPDARRTYVSNAAIETTDWHFISIVVNSETDMKIFVDGFENGGEYSGYGESLVYSLTPGCIGRHDRNLDQEADYFMGSIDDFAYWGERSLTNDEVNQLRMGTVTLGTDSPIKVADNFVVYPNPAHEKIQMSSGFENEPIVMFNSLGQEIYTGLSSDTIDVSAYSPGVYFIKAEGSIQQTKKIIIK